MNWRPGRMALASPVDMSMSCVPPVYQLHHRQPGRSHCHAASMVWYGTAPFAGHPVPGAPRTNHPEVWYRELTCVVLRSFTL